MTRSGKIGWCAADLSALGRGSGLRWLVVVLALAGCQDPKLDLPLPCTKTSQCPSGYHCKPARDSSASAGTCVGDVGCVSDGDCCLGERCELQRCRHRQMCSTASPCGDTGTACLDNLCVPQPCGANRPCPSSATTCLWDRCVSRVPCAGSCGANEACAVLLDRCVKLHDEHLTCLPGELRVLTNDAERLPEGCGGLPELTACKPLPPLPEGRIGVPGVLVPIPGGLAHVAYDQTYGDIVLGRYPTAPPLQRKDLCVLTGLPDGAKVVGAVTGPRGGIREPGPDRGEVLDAVADGKGRILVAYRDTTADTLRFLEVAADGKVVRDHVLRQEPGIGRAVAIALLPGGVPVVAAFTPAGPGQTSHLRLLTANLAAPQRGEDWKVQELEAELLPSEPTPCGGPCPPDRVCARQGEADLCATVDANCSTCLPAQVCHAGQCLERRIGKAAVDDVARGRGAWLDLATTAGGAVVVAAYSPSAGDLAVYRGAPGLPFAKTTVNGKTLGSDDIGRFVALVLTPEGRAWLACEDTRAGRLLLAREQDKGGFALDVLDDGNRSDGHHRIGADVALLRHPAGGVLAVAQDTRRADLVLLRVSVPGGKKVDRTVLVSDGAAGFSSSVVAVGSKAFAVASTTWQVQANGTATSQVVLSDVIWSGE